MANTPRKQTTTRINGKRVRIVTTAAGTKVTAAPVAEWELQAEAVRRLRAMPEFADDAAAVTSQSFTLAADFNAGKRDATKAKATGVTAGETDLRAYGAAGRLLLVEYKNAEGRLSAEQKERHALLRALGYRVEVIKATTPDECAVRSVELVRGWVAGNDNRREAA